MYATIGNDIDTGHPIMLGDIERRSGLYILGRTGMGKSWLLANLTLKDIEHGHGVFFLDPHGDAIEDIIASLPLGRTNDVISLHPEHKTRSFGINLFACKDVQDSSEREATYTRARNVFSKIFESEWGTWGPWMQMALQNTLYAFIDNQGYTLADVPQFLKNPDFRDHIVSNITHNPAVADFWRYEFSPVQAQSLSTRVNILLGHPLVNHIVGQQETTIDFAEIMDKRYIVLVKLSANLSADIKKFIGTLLISELVHAARRRESIPADKRHQFCIYIDEFQNFASSEDFAILFTQARKYGIATTIAHQERRGQFADNQMILGATAAAANNIFFQLTVKDAQELAPEFAKPPPTETKLEQQLVISQDPFPTLLRGHDNPQIREFVRRYLRPLQYLLEDAKEETEGEKLLRQYFIDLGALYRVYERMAELRNRAGYSTRSESHFAQYNALLGQQNALADAISQSEKLIGIHRSYTRLRLRLRSLNEFFTSLMEGRIEFGKDEFSLFIAQFVCASSFSLVPLNYVQLLTLYIVLKYGNPKSPRSIPFVIAQAYGVFQHEVGLLTHQAAEKTRKARQEFQENYIKEEWEDYIQYKQRKALCRQQELGQELVRIRALGHRAEYSERREYERLLEECADVSSLEHRREVNNPLISKLPRQLFGFYDYSEETYSRSHLAKVKPIQNIYINYVWLLSYSELFNVLAPYSTAQFTPRFEGVMKHINNLSVQIDNHYYQPPSGHPLFSEWLQWGQHMKASVIKQLKEFLLRYKEGAFVMFSLLDAARFCDFNQGLVGLEPIELLRVVKKLNEFMRNCNYDVFIKYFDRFRLLNFCKRLEWNIWNVNKDDELDDGFRKDLIKEGFDFSVNKLEMEVAGRKEVRFLRTTLIDGWSWFSKQYPTAASQWLRSDELTHWYLLNRACDLVYFGQRIANETFPQPTFSGAEDLVSSLASLLKDTEARLVKEKQGKKDDKRRLEEAKKREEIAEECAEKIAKIAIRPPDNLDPRVLSENELETLTNACVLENFSEPTSATGDVNGTLKVVNEFGELCLLLKRPENHIKVPSGQYAEKQVNTRTYADMTHEMATGA